MSKPIVALVFFFSFVADWNNFFLPYVVLADSNQYPITVGLWDLLSSTPRQIALYEALAQIGVGTGALRLVARGWPRISERRRRRGSTTIARLHNPSSTGTRR